MTVIDDQRTLAITALPGLDLAPPRRMPTRSCARWERPAVLALLVPAAALYLWALGSSGWANDLYGAAVQAGTQDWEAWLFGSLDPGNVMTIDKPPAALWVMVLSARLFGFSHWSMLVPQALMGVGAVAVLYAAVRRCSGPVAALAAGTVLAVTPVAALMFRYNHPDALLVLLLVVAAYCMQRAVERAGTWWIVLAGTAIGFAFLTEMLQAFLVVPAFVLVFLIAAPGAVGERLAKLLAGAAAVVVFAGWYVALVSLWPASSRPYIGGSTDNSLLQLALGYNGIGRDVGGGGNGGAVLSGGGTGVARLFGAGMGTEISWLLPAALIGLLAGLWMTARAPRTDRVRASLLMWGGWLLVSAVVFSFIGGVVNPYYTVALAPAVAALIGISGRELLRRKGFWAARVTLAAMSAVTGGWAFVLLDRTPQWLPGLRWVVLIGSIVAAALLALASHRRRRGTLAVAMASLVLGLAAPVGYTIDTVTHPHNGPVPTSGPGARSPGSSPAANNSALRSLLVVADTRWAAASVGALTASSLELRTGTSVMMIGGFAGFDPSPTLAQFQRYVADKQVRYFIADETGGPGGGQASTDAAAITTWVRQHFAPMDVGGTTVYDLFTAQI